MRKAAAEMRPVTRYRYIFCIIPYRKNYSFTVKGRKSMEVYAIHYKDISAIVADAWSDKYEILDDGLTHEKVVETVWRQFPVIPMGFGQSSTEQDIKAFLIKNYTGIKNLFKRLEGKTELGINVTLNQEKAIEDIFSSDSRVRNLAAWLKERPEKDVHKAKIKIGRMVAEELEKKGEDIASDFYQTLAKNSESHVKCGSTNPMMVLNAAFLVKNEDIPEFDRILNKLENKYDKIADIRYIISPPYNFANMRVKRHD